MSNYTFHIERFDQTYAEMEPLYRQHFAEWKKHRAKAGVDTGNFQLDTEGYFAYAASGQLVTYVARFKGKAVGYLSIYFSRDHRTGEMVASDDSLFVAPGHRNGLGSRLVRFAIGQATKVGAARILINAGGDARVASLLRRIGFKQTAIEMTYDLQGERHVPQTA
jgi:GNAT superfamily N-acetyltransferase